MNYTVLYNTALTSDTSFKFKGPQAILTSDQLATNSNIFTTPSGSMTYRT